MKSVHIVIPDLFLPSQLAGYASADLHLPALEKILARAKASALKIDTLETWLCEHFGVEDMAIAPLTLLADGIQSADAYCLRADPVSISMQRDQMVLKSDVGLSSEEAGQLCMSLNEHFAPDGLRFLAPHPQRWYLRLGDIPAMQTHPLPQVIGADMNAHLPYGADALRWHGVFNEIQMLFYEHAVNQAREQRGEAIVNGVWLWGGGKFNGELLAPFASLAGDSDLAAAFAQAAGLTVLQHNESLADEGGNVLVVFESLRSALQCADLSKWRDAVQLFEKNYLEPLLSMLEAGNVEHITLDVLSENASRRFVLTRAMLWKLWRRPVSLLHYALE